MTNELDRCRGALIGLAVGDALGTTLEFKPPGTFEPIDDMVGGGPFGLNPGEWTDDTSMALCLAESLLKCGGFDPRDQMQRYLRWWQEGHLSSTGDCFDIGTTTQAALARFKADDNPLAGSTDPRTAGNGSLMRLAPVPIYFRNDPAAAIEWSGESSRTTHGARTTIDACRYFAGLLLGALAGADKNTFLAPLYHPADGAWPEEAFAPEILAVAKGSFLDRDPPEIRGTGHVVRSLEAALWAFARSNDFRSGALMAVNLGDDADTTGAIYGQIAGAFYGASGVPTEWRERLAMRSLIEDFADRLATHPLPLAGEGGEAG